MLLKAIVALEVREDGLCFSTLYRVDAIEGPDAPAAELTRRLRFSTLYRVDAIEGTADIYEVRPVFGFQYPLSGRCY